MLDVIEKLAIRIELFFSSYKKAIPQFLALFAIFLFFNLNWLRPFQISLDSEFAFFRMPYSLDGVIDSSSWRDSTIWIVQGRWMTYIIEAFLLPNIVVPIFPYLIFGIAISISYIILIRVHRLNYNYLTIMTFPIFCAFPIWDSIFEFTSNVPSLGIGILLLSISLANISKTLDSEETIKQVLCDNIIRVFISSFLLAASIATYQVTIVMFISFCVGILMLRYRNTEYNRQTIQRLSLLVIVLLLGVVIYFVINSIFMMFIDSNEIFNPFNPGVFFRNPNIVLYTYITDTINLYFGRPNIYGISLSASGFLTLTCLAATLFSSQNYFKNTFSKHKKIIIDLCFVLLLIALTNSLMFIYAGISLPRAMLSVSYTMWLFSIMICTNFSAIIRVISIGIILTLNLQSFIAHSHYAAIRELRYNHDRTLAHDIYNRIARVHEGFGTENKYKVTFYGKKNWHSPLKTMYNTTIDKSFFACPYRVDETSAIFMNILGYSNISYVNLSEQHREIFKSMPNWPNQGCVKVVNDVTLVKFSD